MTGKVFTIYLTVFGAGACIMILELVSSRILGPYFGTPLYVWTNVIGVFLGSLSLGYYLGGKLADRWAKIEALPILLLSSSTAISLLLLVKEPVLAALEQSQLAPALGSLVAAMVLFAPVSTFLGMVTPYAAKLRLDSSKHVGSIIGSLSFAGALGSIVGTFAAGLVLIPYFGTNLILVGIASAIALFAMPFINYRLSLMYMMTLLLIAVSYTTIVSRRTALTKQNFFDHDTQYSRVWVYESEYKGQTIRTMGINAENHSSIYLTSDDLVNEYTRFFRLIDAYVGDPSHVLVLGGAGYTVPRDIMHRVSAAKVDVVEIDPGVTELARKYFGVQDDPRLTIYHEDARTFLNKNERRYDVIIGDAFSSRNSIPYHLTTAEAIERITLSLTDDGVYILNIIGAIEGEKGLFLRAEYKTLIGIFESVDIYPAQTRDPAIVQNIVVVARKNKTTKLKAVSPEIQKMLDSIWIHDIPLDMPILTDDFAPVDYYAVKTL